MPLKMNLTKRSIEAIEPPPTGRIYVYDSKQANLALCVFASSAKTFYRCGRVDGRPERHKLGRFPDVTVENARKAAAAFNGDRAKGIDPRRKRAKVTLQNLFEHWLADAKLRKKTWDYHFSPLRNRRLPDITSSDVARWHGDIGRKRGTYIANRARALLSAVWGKAKDLGFTGENPCKDVKRFREESRERFLLADEMPKLFQALEAEPPFWHDFWLACLFTGARRGNVASMQWSELDLDRGVWYLSGVKMKNGLAMAIVLPPAAVEILQRRQDARTDSPWVFPSGDEHIVDPRKSWARVVKTAGIENLRPHDLRRSLASWQAIAGTSLAIIGASLGHRDPKATSVYARLQLEPVRASVNGTVAKMLEAAKPAETEQMKGANRGKA